MSQWVAIFLLTLITIIAFLLIRRKAMAHAFENEAKANVEPLPLNISRLVLQLTSNEHRERSRNRLLALGPPVIPELLSELIYHRFHIDSAPPELVAEIEGLIIDFGPSAAAPILQRLSEWPTTHRCAPSLVRMCRQLGLETIQRIAEKSPANRVLSGAIDRFLPHLLLGRADIRTCPLFLTTPSSRPADALLVSIQPREWPTLWLRLDESGQGALLQWLLEWPSCIEPSFLEFLMLQLESRDSISVLRLVQLSPAPSLKPLVTNLLTHPADEIRHEAMFTLCFFSRSSHLDFPISEASDENRLNPASLVMKFFSGALPDDSEDIRHFIAEELAHFGYPAQDLAEELFALFGNAALSMSLEVRRSLLVFYPLIESTPSIAFERLLSLCNLGIPETRILAVFSLSMHENKRALEGYRRCITQSVPPHLNRYLQLAASRLGAPISRVIASRFIAKGYSSPTLDRSYLFRQDGHLLLAQLRSTPFVDATDIFLELIESDDKTPLTQAIALTLRTGQSAVRSFCSLALRQSERGLILPTVRYLSMQPDPCQLSALIALLREFEIVRNQVLTLVEFLDDDGLVAIEQAIEMGGDDRELDILIETQRWLRHCIFRRSA